MKRTCTYRYIFYSFFFINKILLAQLDSLTYESPENTFARHRIFIGFADLLPHYQDDENRALFFNYSYRTSPFNKANGKIQVKSSFERGLNIVFQTQWEKKWESIGLIIPYIKFGPEIYFGKNIFLSGNVGLALALIYGFYVPIVPLPFAGLNAFYLIDLSEDTSLEFESGFHTFVGPEKAPFLFYFNVGISFN